MVQEEQWPAFAGMNWGGRTPPAMRCRQHRQAQTQLRVTHDVAGLADRRTELKRFGDRMPIAVERSEGLRVEQLQAGGDVVGIFPDRPALLRLVGAVLAEQHDEWTQTRRYIGPDILTNSRTATAEPTHPEEMPLTTNTG
jgi:Transposase, Mutator family